jgi:hypothetical protein
VTPRLTAADRELLLRLVSGEDEFQAGLDAVSDADPLLGARDDD